VATSPPTASRKAATRPRRALLGLDSSHTPFSPSEEATDNEASHSQQESRYPGLDRLAGDRGQEKGAQHPADDAGKDQGKDELPFDVAELVMGDPGNQGGRDLRAVHRRTGDGRGQPNVPSMNWAPNPANSMPIKKVTLNMGCQRPPGFQ